jgi:DNA polymerase-3 subunit beta
VPQKTFKQLLGMVHFAMAQQDIRYYLNGMLLVVDGDQLMAVATDGHRLAFSSMRSKAARSPPGSDHAAQDVLELQRLLEDTDDPSPSTSRQPGQVHLRRHRAVSKLVEGKFPDFQRVIPKGTRTRSRSAAKSCSVAATRRDPDPDKFKGVRCIIAPGS